MDTFLFILRCLLMVYVGLGLFALLFSNWMIFPKKQSTYTDNDDIFKMPLDNGKNISLVYLPNEEAKYTLLYSHGNYEDLGDLYSLLVKYQQFGFAVLAYDYPGYGTSEGRATEKNTYAAIGVAYDYLTNKLNIEPGKIIAIGRSVGGGPAVDLASRKPLGGLILESTFVTAFRVMTRIPILPWDKFSNISKIEAVQCPVLLIHGTEDEVISFWHSKALMEKANQPKLYLWVEGAEHNNVIDFAGRIYWDTLDKFRIDVEKHERNTQNL